MLHNKKKKKKKTTKCIAITRGKYVPRALHYIARTTRAPGAAIVILCCLPYRRIIVQASEWAQCSYVRSPTKSVQGLSTTSIGPS